MVWFFWLRGMWESSLLEQGSNSHIPHWKAKSQPLDQQEVPLNYSLSLPLQNQLSLVNIIIAFILSYTEISFVFAFNFFQHFLNFWRNLLFKLDKNMHWKKHIQNKCTNEIIFYSVYITLMLPLTRAVSMMNFFCMVTAWNFRNIIVYWLYLEQNLRFFLHNILLKQHSQCLVVQI